MVKYSINHEITWDRNKKIANWLVERYKIFRISLSVVEDDKDGR